MIFYLCGMHGSGTSLASWYLHHCGIDMSGGVPIDQLGENKKYRVVSHRILRSSGVHRYGVKFNHTSISPSSVVKKEMQAQIKNSLDCFSNWGWKAPINSLCIWAWLPLLSQCTKEKITIVLIFRNPLEITRSFYRRKTKKDIQWIGKQGKPYVRLEQIWINYNRSVMLFNELHKTNPQYEFHYVEGKVIVASPERFVNALGVKPRPSNGIVDRARFIREKTLTFRTQEGKKLWDSLQLRRTICI